MSKAHIDHIGIIVADIEAAVERFRPLFGDAEPIRELADYGLRVAMIETANVTIELLQYTGDGDDFARGVMGQRLGLNHVSARVDDVRQSVGDLTAQGFRMKDGFPRPGAHGEVAFFERDETTGLLFEVCAPDDDHG
jgi:methylmalonyl-CoA/ethylmalonyl-CoA epimerase